MWPVNSALDGCGASSASLQGRGDLPSSTTRDRTLLPAVEYDTQQDRPRRTTEFAQAARILNNTYPTQFHAPRVKANSSWAACRAPATPPPEYIGQLPLSSSSSEEEVEVDKGKKEVSPRSAIALPGIRLLSAYNQVLGTPWLPPRRLQHQLAGAGPPCIQASLCNPLGVVHRGHSPGLYDELLLR
jgi:hypothetical protein